MSDKDFLGQIGDKAKKLGGQIKGAAENVDKEHLVNKTVDFGKSLGKGVKDAASKIDAKEIGSDIVDLTSTVFKEAKDKTDELIKGKDRTAEKKKSEIGDKAKKLGGALKKNAVAAKDAIDKEEISTTAKGFTSAVGQSAKEAKEGFIGKEAQEAETAPVDEELAAIKPEDNTEAAAEEFTDAEVEELAGDEVTDDEPAEE